MDFKETLIEILDGTYIDQSLYRRLRDSSIESEVQRLIGEIQNLVTSRNNKIYEILEKMNELALYKTILKLKISSAIVTDASENENKYVQARAAFINKNKKRSWISVYLGPLTDFKLDARGKLNKEQIEEMGREKVILKALAKLRDNS